MVCGSIAFLVGLVMHSPAYSRDAEMDGGHDTFVAGRKECSSVMPELSMVASIVGFHLQGQDERKRSTRVVPSWDGQYVRPSVPKMRKLILMGSLSTGSLVGHLYLGGKVGGLMYSQASVMPGNAGGSTACVIGF